MQFKRIKNEKFCLTITCAFNNVMEVFYNKCSVQLTEVIKNFESNLAKLTNPAILREI